MSAPSEPEAGARSGTFERDQPGGVVVAKENFRVTSGEQLVKRYESEPAPRNFCSNCGSSLHDDLGAVYFVAAGLMPDLDLRPSFHQQVTRGGVRAVTPAGPQSANIGRMGT
jgi:hypothetical protein